MIRPHAGSRVAVAVALLGAFVIAATPAPAAQRPKRIPAGVTADGRFIPPARIVGHTEIVPVTLPDGTRLELRAPRRVHLAAHGFATIGSVEWSVRPDPRRCCGRVLQIEHTTFQAKYGDVKPLKTFSGAHRDRIPYYDVGLPLKYLVFQFGPWMVSVYNHAPGDFEDEMSDAELATWARSLDAVVDEDGYLVLRPKPPLHVQLVVQLLFGIPEYGADQVDIEGHEFCGGGGADTAERREFPGGLAWCDAATGLHVSVEGSPRFVNAISDGLHLRTRKHA